MAKKAEVKKEDPKKEDAAKTPDVPEEAKKEEPKASAKTAKILTGGRRVIEVPVDSKEFIRARNEGRVIGDNFHFRGIKK